MAKVDVNLEKMNGILLGPPIENSHAVILDRGNAIFISSASKILDAVVSDISDFNFDIKAGYLTWVDANWIYESAAIPNDLVYKRQLSYLVFWIMARLVDVQEGYPEAWIVTKDHTYRCRLLNNKDIRGNDVQYICDLVCEIVESFKGKTANPESTAVIRQYLEDTYDYSPDKVYTDGELMKRQ